MDDAIEIIKKGLKKDGTLADGHYQLGLAYVEKTKTSKDKDYIQLAEESLKKATELNPSLTHVHNLLAQIYEKSGDYEKAQIRRRLGLADQPTSVDGWLQLGRLYLKKNEPYQAQNCFLKALELDPSSPDAHMELGHFYAFEGKHVEAANEFKSVVTLRPTDEKAWFSLGTVYMSSGKSSDAMTALGKAKEINPNYSDASFNLGLTLYRMGKTLEAEREWEYTINIDPKHPRALYNLANIYELRGEKEKAAGMYKNFIDAAGGNFPAEVEIAKKKIRGG